MEVGDKAEMGQTLDALEHSCKCGWGKHDNNILTGCGRKHNNNFLKELWCVKLWFGGRVNNKETTFLLNPSIYL